ncbi:MAG: hypothetical protein GY818_04865 [Planctomycetaceae bacterium]|nr:hypothetical protein [Planctomycetaceae bacterium]
MSVLNVEALIDPHESLAVDPRIFTDNCVILGAEGCGKTTLATQVFKQLVAAGTSIIAIDTRGDLTTASQSAHGAKIQRGIGDALKESNETFCLANIDLQMSTGIFSAPCSDIPEEFRNEENEILVSALLELLGLRVHKHSPEFSLLVNIIDYFHDRQKCVELAQIPSLIVNPPFQQIGLFGLDDVISKKRRDDFASAVNSLLESPSYTYSSANPGLNTKSLMGTADDNARCTVISFADRPQNMRRFLVAILGSKIRTLLATNPHRPLLIWIDEASDFVPGNETTFVSHLVMGALDRWIKFNTNFAFTAHRLSDLHHDVDNFCDTFIVGQMPEINARKDVVQALDLINPPIDEQKLDEDLKFLKRGQFVFRSRHLSTLKYLEAKI